MSSFITEELTHVMMTEQMGRAVFAYANLPKNKLIESAEILVLSKEDTITVNKTGLRDYTFTYNDDQDCLVMGIGEMFNHSDKANVLYEIVNMNGRPKMMFFTTREVRKGEQLFIDYTADLRPNESKSEYLINLL